MLNRQRYTSRLLSALPLLSEVIAILLAVALLTIPHGVESVRCYCTDDHCVPYGVCEANVCLVGLLKSNNAVIRTCGNEPIGCQRGVDKWSDICACDQSFCNTFSFLRANMGRERSRSSRDESSDLVFQRVDSPLGEFSGFDAMNDDDSSMPAKTSLLTLLLVVVPLSVGAATVLVVAFNYYCHLC